MHKNKVYACINMVMVFRQILREIRHAAHDVPQAVRQGLPPDAFHANFGAFRQIRRLIQPHDPIVLLLVNFSFF